MSAVPVSSSHLRSVLVPAVIVGALGYFVDIYDLILFSIVRVASLKELGLAGAELTDKGLFLINMQMFGMLLGGILWGVLGDRRGRIVLLFGSICLYSVANIANGLVQSIEAYAVWRFIAGVGLAGELGGSITLVAEVLPKESRGYGTMIVSTVGVFGAVVAALIAARFHWRTCYFIGGGLGFALLLLRFGVLESGMFRKVQTGPLDGLARFISAITAARPAAIFARSAPTKSRGGGAAAARRCISASGAAARAASSSSRLRARMRSRISDDVNAITPWRA